MIAARGRSIVVTLFVLCCLLPAGARAQTPNPEWQRLAGPFDPPPAWGHQVVHDPVRHRMLLINSGAMSELWVLPLEPGSPARWQRIAIPGPLPTYRYRFGAAYDPHHDRVLVFGGDYYDPFTGVTRSANDVWALSLGDTPAWTEILPVNSGPSGRNSPIVLYDDVRERLVIFGGVEVTARYPNDVWTLELASAPQWRQYFPIGVQPMGRTGAGAVYDPWSDRMVMYGGYSSGTAHGISVDTRHDDSWGLTLSGSMRWDSLVVSPRPPARMNFTAVLDPVRGQMVIANGDDLQGSNWRTDAWAFNLFGVRAWTPLVTTGVAPNVGGQHGIYSPERNSVIQYGGDWDPYQNLTYELELDRLSWSVLGPEVPDPMPSRRGGSTLIMDPNANQLLVYGGYSFGCQHDLWAYSLDEPRAWTHLPTTGVSPNCGSSAMVHDPRRHRLLSFGEQLVRIRGQALTEVWELPLAGTREWRPLTVPPPYPPARGAFSLVYDSRRDRVLLFGGSIYPNRSANAGDSQDDVWELALGDSLRWRQLPASGTPGARDSHSAYYDAEQDRMLVAGGEFSFPCRSGCGTALSDVWALSLANDSLVWRLAGENMPVPGAVTFDPGRRRLLSWTGSTDPWVLSLAPGSHWEPLAVSGETPTTRSISGLLFDPMGDRLLSFGGYLAQRVAQQGSFTSDLFALAFAGAQGTQVSVVGTDVTPQRVTLEWRGLVALQPVSIEMAEGDSVLRPLLQVTADGSGHIRHIETRVVPGRRYRFALSIQGGARRVGETTITVPLAPAFSLAGARPNPAVQELSVEFSLIDASPARLDVYDLAGRRVLRREVGTLGTGRHQVSFGRLAPGVYVVRLAQGARNATQRVAVLR